MNKYVSPGPICKVGGRFPKSCVGEHGDWTGVL